ncbi:MAG: potassium-transporting ATPase subunit KdpC [Firmicutes bacterium]|nr:potassium-transporting ATPase subunit KdpC [Bacillota bacterium]
MKYLKPLIGVSVFLWLLLGLAYPLAMTGISELVFPYQANGSQVKLNGRVVADAQVGQFFNQMGYFWGRPSDTVSTTTGKPEPYNAYNSAPSNLGPTNKALISTIKARIAYLEKTNPGLKASQIPPDLVEGSGSGLDPYISVQGAVIQIPRVAKATGLSASFLRTLVQQATLGPQWGLFGHTVVNVTELNINVYKALHG